MAITSRANVLQTLAEGKGVFSPCTSATGINVSSAVAASGYFTAQLRANGLLSTMPSTLFDWPLPPAIPSTTLLQSAGCISTAGSGGQFWGYFYKLGTLDLTATGDKFTHDAATFPVLRTIFGATSTAVPLIPLIQITTALTTTAAVFRARTVGGAAGYVNQSGTSVIGTKTMTMPSATTVAGSTFFLRLEDGDSAVTDITNIEVTTAATAGAATVWGFEMQTSTHNHAIFSVAGQDCLYGGLAANDMSPALATSGTATVLYGCLTMLAGTGVTGGFLWGVRDT